MLDLTSLFYALVLGFGIFGLDAVWSSATVKTDFQVSAALGNAGVGSEFATAVFARELEEVFATPSLVKAPSVRSSHEKTFVSVMADSMGLKNAAIAFQDLFGLHPVKILATLTTESGQRRLELVGVASARGTFYVSLEAEPGETTVALIRRGALDAAIRIDPYHTALYLLDPPVGAPDVARARRVLDDALAAQEPTPINTMRGRFHNLRGIVALLDQDKAGAAAFFEEAIGDDSELVSAHLNLAFIRIEQGRYADAAMIVGNVLRTQKQGLQPSLLATAHTISGVIAWSQKQFRTAEEHFGAAVAAVPLVSDANIYWGRMLVEIGRSEEGRRKIRQGEANLVDFENYAEVAMLYFWLTEKDEGPLRLRPRAGSGVALKWR